MLNTTEEADFGLELEAALKSLNIQLTRIGYAGVLLNVATAAIQLCLCFHGLALYRSSSSALKAMRRRSVIISFVILAVFLLYTILEAVKFSHIAFETDFKFLAWALDQVSTHLDWDLILGSVSTTIIVMLGDGVLIYRCYAFLQDHPARWIITGILLILYVAATTMSILGIILLRSTSDFSMATFLAWLVLSAALNTLASGSICLRLHHHRKRLATALNNNNSGSHGNGRLSTENYTGVIAILVESALPFTILGIVGALAFAIPREEIGYPALAIILTIWVCSAALLPQLIIFRVAIGSSYTHDFDGTKTRELSKLEFSPPPDEDDDDDDVDSLELRLNERYNRYESKPLSARTGDLVGSTAYQP